MDKDNSIKIVSAKVHQELKDDCELFRSFLWDDHDETWPEDVHAALHRAMDRLMAEEED